MQSVLPIDLKNAENTRQVWSVVAGEGAVPDDFTKAEMWVHVAGKKLIAGARVEVTAYDGNWMADYLVRSATGLEVNVACLHVYNFSPIVAKASKDFDVEYAGPVALWRVLRKADKSVMVDKLKTESEAYRWLEITPKANMRPLTRKAA
jgi:hypothetical protein